MAVSTNAQDAVIPVREVAILTVGGLQRTKLEQTTQNGTKRSINHALLNNMAVYVQATLAQARRRMPEASTK